MRMIDADALMKFLEKKNDTECNTCTDIECFDCFMEMIEEQPTVNECIPCKIHEELQNELDHAQERNKEYIETIQNLKNQIAIINNGTMTIDFS